MPPTMSITAKSTRKAFPIWAMSSSMAQRNALLAIGYLIYCQATKQKPDESILGLFSALGLASLRAGIKGAVVQALNDEVGDAPPASNPGGNGSLTGGRPLIALSLAATFAGYSALKRGVAAPAVVSVTLEVLVMAPFAVGYLIYATAGYGGPGVGWFGHDLTTSLWLPLTGLITGGPLMLFSYSARRVSLATLGLAQYLNPTLQFLTAVLLFGEPFSRWHAVAFTLIWVALGVYSFEAWRQDKAVVVSGTTMDGSAQYQYEPDPDAPEQEFKLRKNGRWVRAGESMRRGTGLALGCRDEYYDPSF